MATNKYLTTVEVAMKTTGTETATKKLKASKDVLNELANALGKNAQILKQLTPSISTPFATLGKQVQLVTFAFKTANGELRKMQAYIDTVGGSVMRIKTSPASLPGASPFSKAQAPWESNVGESVMTSVRRDVKNPYPVDYKGVVEQYRHATTATENLAKAHDKLKFSATAMIQKSSMIVPIWMAIRVIYQSVFQLIGSSIKFLVEWETIMAQIKIVSDEGEVALKKLSKALLQVGTDYAVSLKDLGEGARLWAQQGKSYADIVPLMESTATLSRLTGRTMSDSVEDLTSAMYSFGLEAKDTTKVVDSLVAVDNKFAITTTVLVSAMRRVGPVAKQIGVPLENLLGIITATHLATRASGDEIGNAWKTIFTRMTTTARDTIQTLGNVPVYIDKMGNATKENTGSFRSWVDIISELAVSYQNLNTVQQADLAEMLTGVRQITKMQAFFNQYKESIEATGVAMNSHGAAQRAMNIYMNTTEAKVNQLKDAWFQLVEEVGDTGAWKSGLDGIRGILDEIRKFVRSSDYTEMVDFFRLFGEYTVASSKSTGNVIRTVTTGEAPSKRQSTGSKFWDATSQIAGDSLTGIWNATPVGGLVKTINQFRQDAAKKNAGNVSTPSSTSKSAGVTAADKKQVADKEQILHITEEMQKLEFQRYDDLKNYGFLDSEIAQMKLKYISQVATFDEKKNEELKQELALNIELNSKKEAFSRFLADDEVVQTRLIAYGYTRIDIARVELQKYEELLKVRLASEDQVLQKRRELAKTIQDEINSFSKGLEDGMAGGLAKLLGGDSTLDEFGDSITKTYKDAILGSVAQDAVSELFGGTGLGQAFGSQILGLKDIFNRKPTNLYEAGKFGVEDGGKKAALEMKTKIEEGGKKAAQDMSSATSGGKSGGVGGSSMTANDIAKGVGGVINAGLVGYSAYKNAGGGGRGMAAGWLGGAGSLVATIPGYEAVGGLMMVASMMFSKKQKETQKTVETELKNIATKIQVSNKELQVVNRNLVALRNEKTFILPESAYFSSKLGNIEDAFSVHSSRGLVG